MNEKEAIFILEGNIDLTFESVEQAWDVLIRHITRLESENKKYKQCAEELANQLAVISPCEDCDNGYTYGDDMYVGCEQGFRGKKELCAQYQIENILNRMEAGK